MHSASLSTEIFVLSIAIKYAENRIQRGPGGCADLSFLDYLTHQRKLLLAQACAYSRAHIRIKGKYMLKSYCRISITAALLVYSLVAIVSAPAVAQSAGIGSLLGGASDNALDKLAQPGAFFADKAVRILLPGPLEKASKLLRFTGKAGLADDLKKSMNDVASLAAKEAKPIFRTAIDGLSLKDGIGIAKESGGATQYLRDSSGDALRDKIRPLVFKAMGEAGTFEQLDKLSSVKGISKLGINSDNMTDHVTGKALDGIFKYMAAEENKARKNPLKAIGGLLGIDK